jgi:hypothetical protein
MCIGLSVVFICEAILSKSIISAASIELEAAVCGVMELHTAPERTMRHASPVAALVAAADADAGDQRQRRCSSALHYITKTRTGPNTTMRALGEGGGRFGC